ncbi:dihydroorotate dehydrogenase electron transfer subunit [Verrucomicrobiota bacterium]
MKIEQARVLNHTECPGEYALLSLEAPAIAASAKPGQFMHLRIPRLADAVLRRPFSIYKVDGKVITIFYKCVGKGTRTLKSVRPDEEISVMGPLGNGFPIDLKGSFPVLIAGGYGVAPLSFLAARMPVKGIVFIGGTSSEHVLCIEDFKSLGWDIRIATEDGSAGDKGVVTDILDSWLEKLEDGVTPEFFACGPDGMLKATGERAIKNDCKAWLSLEKHMGCGVGACLACVHKIKKNDGSEAWGRVCKDGPVFEAREIVW